MALSDIAAFVPPAARRSAATPAPRPRSELLGRILREPLLHFLIAGGVLLALARMHTSAVEQHRIVVTPEQVAKLEDTFRLQYGARPNAAMREDLVRRWIDEEALYREGLARGLDRDDEIIRRRLVQKMQFLAEDLAAPAQPTDADLRAYYQSHQSRYRTPERVSFSHVFFSPDRRGETGAQAAAEAALRTLTPGTLRAAERGDAFSDLYDYDGFGPADAERLFGDTPIARTLFTAPVGAWSGPYRSGFGWHLVRIDRRTAPAQAPFEAVTAQVRDDVQTEAAAKANARAMSDLVRRYNVVRADLRPAS